MLILPKGTKVVAINNFKNVKIGDIGEIGLHHKDKNGNQCDYMIMFPRVGYCYDFNLDLSLENYGVCVVKLEENPTEIIIQIPEGMVIDEENSTFSKIKFKPKEKEYPKTWEELKTITGYFVINGSNLDAYNYCATPTIQEVKNVFSSEEQAKASIALAQLTQLLKAYNGDWKPNWNNTQEVKFVIEVMRLSELEVIEKYDYPYLLSFKDGQRAEIFLSNFKDLIKEASPLLFGYTF